jgi:hypothetical protein
MANPGQKYKPYSAIRVSIPNDGAAHNIQALMSAVDPQAPIHAKYFTIQNDVLTSTANAIIGEGPLTDQGASNPAAVTTSNYGVVLLAKQSETFGGFWDEYINICRFYVINDGTSTGVVNLCIQAARG